MDSAGHSNQMNVSFDVALVVVPVRRREGGTQMSVLLLNASYEPLTVVSWKRAVTLMVTGRAEMVEQDGDRVVRSSGGAEFPLPQVVRLMRMVSFAGMRRARPPRFSKAALSVRDRRQCQVTGCPDRGTTVDHIVPRSRDGATSWENCVLQGQQATFRAGLDLAFKASCACWGHHDRSRISRRMVAVDAACNLKGSNIA